MPITARSNPYPVGSPVKGTGFIGREDIMRRAGEIFHTEGLSGLVIFGQRRIGKTSILLEIKRRFNSENQPVVYFDLMDMADKPFSILLNRLASAIGMAMDLDEDFFDRNFKDDGSDFEEEFLPQVYKALEPKQRLVLLFDEFDVLDIVRREKLPETFAANSFFPILRKWMQTQPKLVFGFVLGRELSNMDTDFLSTFKGAITMRVSVFSRESSKKVLTLPKDVHFTNDALDRIYYLTHGHPFFLQFFGWLLYERIQKKSEAKTDILEIETTTVDEILPDLLESADNVFAWIWNGLPPAERILTAVLANLLEDEKITATHDDLLEALQSQRLRVITNVLENAPDRLTEWQILESNGKGYKFLIPVFHQWVKKKKTIKEVQIELDRSDPIALRYYEIGQFEYENNNLPEAVSNLKKVLRVNPDHIQARLALGQIYLEQGLLKESVAMYEEAYLRDEDRAANGLIKSLIALAEINDADTALSAYKRILEIRPNHPKAIEYINRFWKQRAEYAVEQQDYEAARFAYREAGLYDKYEEVTKLVDSRNKKLESSYIAGVKSLDAGEWEIAEKNLVTAMEIDPNYKNVAELLLRSKNANTNQLLLEANDSLKKENFDKTEELLLRAQKISPGNANIETMLTEVIAAKADQENLAIATKHITEEHYKEAITFLKKIPEASRYASKSRELVKKANSLRIAHRNSVIIRNAMSGIFFFLSSAALGYWLVTKLFSFIPAEAIINVVILFGAHGLTGGIIFNDIRSSARNKGDSSFGCVGFIFSSLLALANIVICMLFLGIGWLIRLAAPNTMLGFYIPAFIWVGILTLIIISFFNSDT